MEIVIVICLLIVIVLLAKDKIVIKNVVPKDENPPYVNPKLPEIMGISKPIRRLSVPNLANKNLAEELINEIANFESEIKENDFDIKIPQEELDEVFGTVSDYEDEEKEWKRYKDIDRDDSFGFASGVTFEELSSVGSLLQREMLKPSQQNEAVKIVQKIQGTELFSLLEQSIENASQKIARLLDKSINQDIDSGSSTMRNESLNEFNIDEFI